MVFNLSSDDCRALLLSREQLQKLWHHLKNSDSNLSTSCQCVFGLKENKQHQLKHAFRGGLIEVKAPIHGKLQPQNWLMMILGCLEEPKDLILVSYTPHKLVFLSELVGTATQSNACPWFQAAISPKTGVAS